MYSERDFRAFSPQYNQALCNLSFLLILAFSVFEVYFCVRCNTIEELWQVVRTTPMNPSAPNESGQYRMGCRLSHTVFSFPLQLHRYPGIPFQYRQKLQQSCPLAMPFLQDPAIPHCPCLQRKPHGKYPICS